MEKIAASHIKNLIVKGCTPVLKTVKQPPDLLEDYKEEFGSIGQYLHTQVVRSRGSVTTTAAATSVPSGHNTSGATLPPTNITPISKQGPTLVRLAPVSTGTSIGSTTSMAMATEQISLPGQVQAVPVGTVNTVLASTGQPANLTSIGGLGNNAQQKIIVMSPSPAGQVQIVQQTPQAPQPPTSQWGAVAPVGVKDSNISSRPSPAFAPSNSVAASMAAGAQQQIYLKLPNGGTFQVIQKPGLCVKIKQGHSTE